MCKLECKIVFSCGPVQRGACKFVVLQADLCAMLCAITHTVSSELAHENRPNKSIWILIVFPSKPVCSSRARGDPMSDLSRTVQHCQDCTDLRRIEQNVPESFPEYSECFCCSELSATVQHVLVMC